MLRPRKMKLAELTVFKNDMDNVLEYLGNKGEIQFPEPDSAIDSLEVTRIKMVIQRLIEASEYLETSELEKDFHEEVSFLLNRENEKYINDICCKIEEIKDLEHAVIHEKQRILETINEANAFSKMNMPFADFEHLSYLTMRLGRIEQKYISELRNNMGERAVIILLDDGIILAACSKKGRFALDTQLKKMSFEPVKVPQNYRGIPAEMMTRLNEQYDSIKINEKKIKEEKEKLRRLYFYEIKRLTASLNLALSAEKIKSRFSVTENLYHFSGWVPADILPRLTKELTSITDGRIAIYIFSPEEVPSVKNGNEKVPVVMKNNAFIKGFESIVFSYGAPLYGTVDPTFLVAFFFTIMFGIMFGDVGQGFVLLLAGIIIYKSKKKNNKLKKFSIPLISVGISSMIMGFLAGSVFANEKLLVTPTRIITQFITGQPMDRILHILPMAGEGGSIIKLMYFFAFTLSIGIAVNSLGLIINIYNRCFLKKYKQAFFSKTGLAGLLLFWYALFIAIRVILGGRFEIYDYFGIFIPLLFIFFAPVIWRFITNERPVMEKGFLSFVMEGFVEIMETISIYFSNTMSFLRIGAFALAHAVFSFIIFYFTEELAFSGITGTIYAAIIMIIGNVIIIALEGLIVAIQVIRLQYYEFFNKFFMETGVEFAPFRFNRKEKK